MLGKIFGWDDTIVALATPQGVGAISIIRVSGSKAFETVNKIFPSKNVAKLASHTIHLGKIVYNDVVVDEVLLSIFKNPASYTGEDVIEISCHGSLYVQEKIIEVLTALGARLAKPGEFTQRAFLNGKLDLAQAEAVADLIASNSEASTRTALQNMRGGFSNDLKNLREELLQFSALIELELDFAEEDVEFADRSKLIALLVKADAEVSALLQSFKLGNVIKNGVQVAIAGKPNSGKSTLLNALLNEERAIVSDIAGTTRDTIEETLSINGILFRLADTAGIRNHTSDKIEQLGIDRSFEKIRAADAVIYLFDVNETSAETLDASVAELQQHNKQLLLAGNKIDASPATAHHYTTKEPVIFLSAKNKTNINPLKEQLYKLFVNENINPAQTIITNARHVAALEKVKESIDTIMQGLQERISSDLLTPDIRICLYYLGDITGEVTNEDQLDYIFSKFCIGK